MILLDNCYFILRFEPRAKLLNKLPVFLSHECPIDYSGCRKRFTLDKIKYFFQGIKKKFEKKIEFKEGAWSGINIKASSSFDDEIARKGAIIDNMGNAHTTAHSYKQYLKDNGLVIRDWAPGSNSDARKLKGCTDEDVYNAARSAGIRI